MRYFFILIIFAICTTTAIQAQKLYTKTGQIEFYSDNEIEPIEAVSNAVLAVMDTDSDRMQVKVLIRSFQFEKALMQEHFNENYMESETFPKAVFSGHLIDPESTFYGLKNGTFEVEGELTMHGVKQPLRLAVNFDTLEDNKVQTKASFDVRLSDYKIKIPSVIKDIDSETIHVHVNLNFQPMATQ